MKRFFAFATEQNHASLPPILSLARLWDGSGDKDEVIWLETPRAREKSWADRSSQVLVRHGLEVLPSLIIDAESEFSPGNLSKDLLKRLRVDVENIFVLTGGQKHSMLALDWAADSLDPRPTLVYSDLNPVQLRVLGPGSDSFVAEPICRFPSFEELLDSRGLLLYRPAHTARELTKRPKQIWPGDTAPDDGFTAFRRNSQLQSAIFLLYRELTAQGRIAMRSERAEQKGDRQAADEEMSRTHLGKQVCEFIETDPRRMDEWPTLVKQAVQSSGFNLSRLSRRIGLNPATVSTGEARLGFEKYFDEIIDALAGPKRQLFASAVKFLITQLRDHELAGEGVVLDGAALELVRATGWVRGETPGRRVVNENLCRRLGDWFESAVAARLLEFFASSPDVTAPIAEVWQNVYLRKCEHPEKDYANYDLVIYLKNASLVSIECKAGLLGDADNVYARLARLRATAGPAAYQVICAPLFPALPSDSFKVQHGVRQQCPEFGLSFLPYTAEGQHSSYLMDQQEFKVGSFETGLKNLLDRFVPK